MKKVLATSSRYQVPTDPEKALYDFYAIFLVRTGKDFNLSLDLQDYFQDAETQILGHFMSVYSKGLRRAIGRRTISEVESTFRHIQKPLGGFIKIKEMWEAQEFDTDPIVQALLKAASELPPVSMAKGIEAFQQSRKEYNEKSFQAFERIVGAGFVNQAARILTVVMGSSQDVWVSQVVPAYQLILEASTAAKQYIAIDHIFDLQHHNGTIMPWLGISQKDSDTYDWLQKALDVKATLQDERELVKRVSPGLQRFFLKAIHLQTQKSMDSFQDKEEIPLFDANVQGVQTLDGWYEFPNGARAKFKDARVEAQRGYFQADFSGILLLKGTFAEGEWPGGYLREAKKYIKRRELQAPKTVRYLNEGG